MANIISFDYYQRSQKIRRPSARASSKQVSNTSERQGSLDSLCGIYSIVNAVCHVAKLSSEQRQLLFKKLIKTLEKDKCVARCMLHGISKRQLLRLFTAAEQWLKNKHNITLLITPIAEVAERLSMKQYVQYLDNFLYDEEGILIAGIKGIHHHWTCIESVTPKTLQLMDSSGLNSLRVASCRISKKPIRRYHCLNPMQTWGIRCFPT